MIVRKPTVIIYTRDPDEDFLREICAGIEEEGVLYEIHSRDADMDELAFEAAKDSMLGSGIGIAERRIAMQMAKKCRLRLFTGKTGRCRYEHLYKKR